MTVILENGQDDEITGQDDFILELFGEQAQTPVAMAWLSISFSTAKTEISSNLKMYQGITSLSNTSRREI